MVFLVTGVWHWGLSLSFLGTFVVRAMHLLSSLLRLFYKNHFLDAILVMLVLVIPIVSACRPIRMHLLETTIVCAMVHRVAEIGWCLFFLSLKSSFRCLSWVKVRGSSLVDAFEASDSTDKFLFILDTHIVMMALFMMINNWTWNTAVVMCLNLILIVEVLLALRNVRVTELLSPTSWKVCCFILARKSDQLLSTILMLWLLLLIQMSLLLSRKDGPHSIEVFLHLCFLQVVGCAGWGWNVMMMHLTWLMVLLRTTWLRRRHQPVWSYHLVRFIYRLRLVVLLRLEVHGQGLHSRKDVIEVSGLRAAHLSVLRLVFIIGQKLESLTTQVTWLGNCLLERL